MKKSRPPPQRLINFPRALHKFPRNRRSYKKKATRSLHDRENKKEIYTPGRSRHTHTYYSQHGIMRKGRRCERILRSREKNDGNIFMYFPNESKHFQTRPSGQHMYSRSAGKSHSYTSARIGIYIYTGKSGASLSLSCSFSPQELEELDKAPCFVLLSKPGTGERFSRRSGPIRIVTRLL